MDNDPSVGATHQVDIEDELSAPVAFFEAFDEIRAHHILEHIKPENKVNVMATLYKWLKPEGILDIEVPLAGTTQFYQDPTHFTPRVIESFRYFTKGDRFGEAFAKRYSQCEVPLFELVKKAELTKGWLLNITLRKPL